MVKINNVLTDNVSCLVSVPFRLFVSMEQKCSEEMNQLPNIDKTRDRYPCCIVWTPIPLLTWLCPLIGHMGIAMSSGVIRDFAGPYCVCEDEMAFGRPTKYWQLDPSQARGGICGWDQAVAEASEIYKGRVHNLLWDNCHSHVATALNLMHYKDTKWNMVKLTLAMPLHSRYTSFSGLLKTWIPFLILLAVIVVACLLF